MVSKKNVQNKGSSGDLNPITEGFDMPSLEDIEFKRALSMAARILGSAKTPQKIESANENLAKGRAVYKEQERLKRKERIKQKAKEHREHLAKLNIKPYWK